MPMHGKKMLVTAAAALGVLAVVGVSQANGGDTAGAQAARIVQAPQPLAADAPAGGQAALSQQISDLAAQGTGQSSAHGNAVPIADQGVTGHTSDPNGTTSNGNAAPVQVNYAMIDGVLYLFSTSAPPGSTAATDTAQQSQQVLVCTGDSAKTAQAAAKPDSSAVQIKLNGWTMQPYDATGQKASADSSQLIAQPAGDKSLTCTPSNQSVPGK